jgi:excisionase family DNA binding protein
MRIVDKPLVYTVAELAIVLGVAPATAYRAIKLGDLPALRIGKRIVIPRAAVAEMLRKPPRIEDRKAAREDENAMECEPRRSEA